jgi:hypothetical protein
MNNRRSFIDNDTTDQIDKYIDDICSDPVFLCRNKELCGTSTSIYSSVENVNTICKDLEKANECENDFQECVVQASSLFEDAPRYLSTSFIHGRCPRRRWPWLRPGCRSRAGPWEHIHG